ncbi:MAG: DNA-binding protein [Desulfobacterales bacterium]|nr:MAG: DNA-binding protein [Desulfobacterales bacterium]
MPRPKRPRCISERPMVKGFKPQGLRDTGEVLLTLEEFETVKLIDYENYDQAGVAEVMGVSRQTVGRILKAARFKIAQSLVTAKRLTVQGGCYEMRDRGMGRGRRHGRQKLNMK